MGDGLVLVEVLSWCRDGMVDPTWASNLGEGLE